MENKPSSETAPLTRPRLYSIVHTYIQKQLPRDTHPAFEALRDREEEATLPPHIGLTEDPAVTLPTKLEEEIEIVQSTPKKDDDDDDDDIPLYAAPQCNYHSVADLVKRRIVQRCGKGKAALQRDDRRVREKNQGFKVQDEHRQRCHTHMGGGSCRSRRCV